MLESSANPFNPNGISKEMKASKNYKEKSCPPTLQTLFLIFNRRMNSNYSYYEEERNPWEWKRNLETTAYFTQVFIPLLPKTGIINITTTHLLSDWSLLQTYYQSQLFNILLPVCWSGEAKRQQLIPERVILRDGL